MFIYKYTDITNNKVYIGQTCNLEERKYQHNYRAFVLKINYPFYAALRKRTKENFIFEVLEECETSVSDEREIYYISLYNSTNKEKGYNLQNGGGRKSLHESTKSKISIALKGNKNGVRANWSKEALEKRSAQTTAQLVGVPKSEETKSKISKTLTGRKRSSEVEQKRHKSFTAFFAIKKEEVDLFAQLVENNGNEISIRLFHRQTGINRPRLNRIRELYVGA